MHFCIKIRAYLLYINLGLNVVFIPRYIVKAVQDDISLKTIRKLLRNALGIHYTSILVTSILFAQYTWKTWETFQNNLETFLIHKGYCGYLGGF